MGLTFEWDSEKDEANLKKHGVSFSEAATVFADPLTITISDPDHSVGEERYITVGLSYRQRVLVVAHRDDDDRIRIITARLATRRERRDYEEGS
jgi:uncharacterized DUF497 family protein